METQGLRGPIGRYFSELQEQGVWESVAQEESH